jgi:hypothetical protein
VNYRKILLVILVVGLSCLIGCGKSISFDVSGNWVGVTPFWNNGAGENFDLSGCPRSSGGSITSNGETHNYFFTSIEREGGLLYHDIISFDFELDGKHYSYP